MQEFRLPRVASNCGEITRRGLATWESVDEFFFMPEELPVQAIINTVSYLARWQPIDRIVALDEFDLENVAVSS